MLFLWLLLLCLLYITCDTARVCFHYPLIREEFSLCERNIGLLCSYFNGVKKFAKIEGGIFVLYIPDSEDRLCLKIR
jgi:hypothetical protein